MDADLIFGCSRDIFEQVARTWTMSIRIGSFAEALAGASLIMAAVLASGAVLDDHQVDLSASFDASALTLGINEVRALAEAVIALEAPRRSADGATVHEIKRLPRVEQRFPHGLPLTDGGTITARLVSLTYKDAGAPGLSRGDELHLSLETSGASGTCRTEYRFDWDNEDQMTPSSPGPQCSPTSSWSAHRGDATRSIVASLEAFGDDIRLAVRLVAEEIGFR